MKAIHKKDCQRDFLRNFEQLLGSRSSWEVWADFVSMFAQSISNSVDKAQAPGREAEYMKLISKYSSQEQSIFPLLCAATIQALDDNQEQDFLGDLYMSLDLGNHWKGQFFTPYNLCRAMSDITISDSVEDARKRGWASICDPACGAGATLIAAAHSLQRAGIPYQQQALFVGQDVDHVAAMMCYIQLSLLGCAGYICIGNTLTNPLTGHPLFPQKRDGQDLWFTPMFFSTPWHLRRLFHSMDFIAAQKQSSAPGWADPKGGYPRRT